MQLRTADSPGGPVLGGTIESMTELLKSHHLNMFLLGPDSPCGFLIKRCKVGYQGCYVYRI